MKTNILIAIATLVAGTSFAQNAKVNSNQSVESKTAVSAGKAQATSQSSVSVKTAVEASKPQKSANDDAQTRPIAPESSATQPNPTQPNMAKSSNVKASVATEASPIVEINPVSPMQDPKPAVRAVSDNAGEMRVEAAKTNEKIVANTKASLNAGAVTTTNTVTAVNTKGQKTVKTTVNTVAVTGSQSASAVQSVKPGIKVQAAASNKVKTKPVSVKTKAISASHLNLR